MTRNPDLAQRLAIVVSHPTQYYSPWFRTLAERVGLELKVFYLWDFGVTEHRDRTFGTSFAWDVPLLDGYDHEFLPNRSHDPGTHHFRGLDNPDGVEAVASWEPDAVLVFGYNYPTHLRLILSRKLRGIPFLFRGDSHELCPATGGKPRVSRLLRRIIFRRFERFLAVGTANADYFRAVGISDTKIVHVGHCVDNQRFIDSTDEAISSSKCWKQELGISEEAFVFLFAGKFEEKKRPLDLLEAFQRLGSRNSELRAQGGAVSTPLPCLLFVGSGAQEGALKEAAGDEIGKQVFFAPFQNQTEMPKVYATGNVLILPSFGRGETWGLAVNEAMNLQRPAIVSSHVGCGPDLISSGETGWIFPAGNLLGLEASMRAACADAEDTTRMGKLAAERVAKYSYQAAAETVECVVHELAESRRAR